MSVTFSRCGPERAEELHALTQQAYAEYHTLTPPSGALRETVDRLRDELAQHGGVIGTDGRTVVAGARFTHDGDEWLGVRRVAVAPSHQRQGVGRALMLWIHEHARALGYREVRLGVRTALTGNRAFYESLGYRVVGEHAFAGGGGWFELVYAVGAGAVTRGCWSAGTCQRDPSTH